MPVMHIVDTDQRSASRADKLLIFSSIVIIIEHYDILRVERLHERGIVGIAVGSLEMERCG